MLSLIYFALGLETIGGVSSLSTLFISERIKLKMRAHQKLLTVNPGVRLSASMITNALTTKVKSPRVKILMGKVISRKIGRITALIRPRTTARIRNFVNEASSVYTLPGGVLFSFYLIGVYPPFVPLGDKTVCHSWFLRQRKLAAQASK